MLALAFLTIVCCVYFIQNQGRKLNIILKWVAWLWFEVAAKSRMCFFSLIFPSANEVFFRICWRVRWSCSLVQSINSNHQFIFSANMHNVRFQFENISNWQDFFFVCRQFFHFICSWAVFLSSSISQMAIGRQKINFFLRPYIFSA